MKKTTDNMKTQKIANDKSIYSQIMITRQIPINIVNIGQNLSQTFLNIISTSIEGKCIEEGYIKSKSTKILTYSSGIINGGQVIFEVVFECLVCCPVEGMHIKCRAKNITKAGIKAQIDDENGDIPVIIFLARDHHYKMEYFSTIEPDELIKVRVIGQRFELNDEYISIIAELIEPMKNEKKIKGTKAPKIVIDN
jgi:DNA-directed RNA polymerase subunit E'/Rpb7